MVGPVAILPGRQGQGFGRALMAAQADGDRPRSAAAADADRRRAATTARFGFVEAPRGWQCPGPWDPARAAGARRQPGRCCRKRACWGPGSARTRACRLSGLGGGSAVGTMALRRRGEHGQRNVGCSGNRRSALGLCRSISAAGFLLPLHLGWSGASYAGLAAYLVLACALFTAADAMTQRGFLPPVGRRSARQSVPDAADDIAAGARRCSRSASRSTAPRRAWKTSWRDRTAIPAARTRWSMKSTSSLDLDAGLRRQENLGRTPRKEVVSLAPFCHRRRMPYEAPPDMRANVAARHRQSCRGTQASAHRSTGTPRKPPTARWRIAADGGWLHEGRPITRPAMVRAFASLLMRGADGRHWLVTPECRQAIVRSRTRRS